MRKILLIALLLLTTSCAEYLTEYHRQLAIINLPKAMKIANDKIAQAKKTCSEQYSTPTKRTACFNDAVMEAYTEANYPYMDIVNEVNAKRAEIAERVEAKKITNAQGQLELAEYANDKTETIRQREAEIQQVQQQKQEQQAAMAAVMLGNMRPYQPAPIAQPYVPQPYVIPIQKPTNCNSYVMGNNINTSCY